MGLNRFGVLFKKELSELCTFQNIIVIIFIAVIFSICGNVMENSIDESIEKSSSITLCDMDNTDFTKSAIKLMEASGCKVEKVDIQSDKYIDELDRLGKDEVVIIPKGFTQNIKDSKPSGIKYISRLKSLSTLANANVGSTVAVNTISEAVKSAIFADKQASGKLTQNEIDVIQNPVKVDEYTVVGHKIAQINITTLVSLVTMQSVFVPIIVFLMVTYASQLVMAAISTEKIDKTLETLLSTPVSRGAVVGAKMLAAAVMSLLNCIVYMFGMNNMMKSLMDSIASDEGLQYIIGELGLKLSVSGYVMMGVQMLLSILIALSVSIVLGVLAKDTKAAQGLIMPIMILLMIPYFISMMVDLNSLPVVIKTIIYAIPFTHTFMANQNILLGNMPLYWFGVIYQTVILVICIIIATRIIMSDKMFIMSISFDGKKKRRKNKKAN